MKNHIFFIITLVIILLLLLNYDATLEGSVNGLILWLNTIVPTLLPFMILSSILIKLHGERILNKLIAPLTSRLFGLSPGGSYVFFVGLLCGYPLGAKTAADLLREKRICPGEAQYLMNFCNNTSPFFLVSFVCTSLLNNKAIIPYAIALIYGIPLSLAVLTKKLFLHNSLYYTSVPNKKQQKSDTELITIIDASVVNAATTALKLGGYIILFSVFYSLIANSHFIPEIPKIILSIVTEVTAGCKYCVTSQIITAKELSIPFVFSCVSFGGLCGVAQTLGMIHGTSLSIKQYLLFRVTCAVLIYIIAYLAF